MDAKGEPVLGTQAAPVSGNTVNNSANTINNYFSASPGPTAVPDDPDAWLPADRDAGRPTRRTRDGTLLTISGVCSWTKRVAEEEWKARIDADRPRCELLCANCHHEHTHGKREE